MAFMADESRRFAKGMVALFLDRQSSGKPGMTWASRTVHGRWAKMTSTLDIVPTTVCRFGGGY